jgi:orotidine-5'-phosphate decarboxylase
MTLDALIALIRERKSCLVVGLDSDEGLVPRHLLGTADPVLSFNQQIIAATQDLCIGYKINTAFYEDRGVEGWHSLQSTLDYIPEGLLKIADAKRGDIGNTSRHYARTFFETYAFDAVTVSPYMGQDSVMPFLEYPGKWTIILALTSNPGSNDFQMLDTEGGPVYLEVIRKGINWGTPEQLMFVAGATHPRQLSQIRALAPDHFLLVPGFGAQGGNIGDICRSGMNADGGLLLNVSRKIIYASPGEDFASKAREAARGYVREIQPYLPG